MLILVLLPVLAAALQSPAADPGTGGTGASLWMALGVTIGKVVLFVAMMLLVGRRLLPWLLDQVAQTGSRELFTLAVVALAIGVAFGSAELFDVSLALGAFLAGIIVNESDHSHRAAKELRPLQDAFGVLFFVSVGMLFDPQILLDRPLQVLAVLAVIMLGKSLAALLIVLAFRRGLAMALAISASLGQIGEFSFILAGLGVSLRLLPQEGVDLILAGALLSITLNPLLFRLIEWRQGPRSF